MDRRMQAQSNAPIVLSTSKLAPHERFDAWRELFVRNVGRADITTPDRLGFKAHIRVLPMPQVTLSKNHFPACNMTRTPGLLRDDDGAVTFSVCLKGRVDSCFGERRAIRRPGQAGLVPHHELGALHIREPSVTYSLRIDRELAPRLVASLDRTPVYATPPGDPGVALLTAHCNHLMEMREGLPPGLAALAGRQLVELLAHIFDPQSDLARAAPFGGIKAARLRAVLDDIAAHLFDPELSAETVAVRLKLTPRYVYQLLDGIGVSFARHVRKLRLDAAERMLRDAASMHLRITDIAYAVGFQDLSYFNREFRRHFGETPSQARQRC